MNLPEELLEDWKGKFHLYIRSFYHLPEILTQREKKLFLNESMKITFVRHPFVRLVSTFQDKVLDHNHRNWREKLIEKPSNAKVRYGTIHILRRIF